MPEPRLSAPSPAPTTTARALPASPTSSSSAAAVLASPVPTSSPTATARPRLYLALGDSLAAGIGATDPERQGYVGLFHRFLGTLSGEPPRLLNLAVGGESAASFATGRQLARAVAAIADPETDIAIVTLDIGGNDLLRLLRRGQPCRLDPAGRLCRDAAEEEQASAAVHYAALLATLQGALATDGGRGKLLVMAYYNPFQGPGILVEERVEEVLLGSDGGVDCQANLAEPARVGLNDLIACLGTAFGATIVDTHPLFQGRAASLTHIGMEDIHPNDAGHRVIAQAFMVAYGAP